MKNLTKPTTRKLLALAIWVSCLASLTGGGGVRAQGISPVLTLDCGPSSVDPGDLVYLNVGNSDRGPMKPATLLLRLLDNRGRPLAERRLRLRPRESRRLRLLVEDTSRGPLVRGEVLQLAGPKKFRVFGTLQIQKPGVGQTAVGCDPTLPTTPGKTPA